MKPHAIVTTVGVVVVILGAIATLDLLTYIAVCIYVRKLGVADMLLIFMRPDTAVFAVLGPAKLIAGIGLLLLRRWGRTIALAAFCAEYLIGLLYAVAFCIAAYGIRDLPEPLHEALTVQTIAWIWPLWIQAFIALLLIAILSRETVRPLLTGPEGRPR